jgi:hypothetical protein
LRRQRAGAPITEMGILVAEAQRLADGSGMVGSEAGLGSAEAEGEECVLSSGRVHRMGEQNASWL